MPMTPEEQAAFDAAKAEAASVKAELEALKKGPPVPPKKGDDDDKTILEKARQIEAEGEKKKQSEKALVEAAKFTVSLSKIVEDNEAFFPKEIAGIMEVNAKKPYDNELARANDLRASIIESVFSEQKNLDLLSETAKIKVQEFFGFNKTKKEEVSQTYWEYVLTALDTNNRITKLDRISKARNGINMSSGWEKDHEDKIFGLTKKQERK